MLVVTPCRTATGMEFIMEQNRMEYSIEREPAKHRENKSITHRIKACLLQKTYRWYRRCSIEIICMFICFIGLLVSSHMLTLLVCMIHMTRYMFSPYPCKDLCLLDQRKHSIRYDWYFSLMFVVVCVQNAPILLQQNSKLLCGTYDMLPNQYQLYSTKYHQIQLDI